MPGQRIFELRRRVAHDVHHPTRVDSDNFGNAVAAVGNDRVLIGAAGDGAATMYSNRLALMDHYVSTMDTLRNISEKELSTTPLSTNETLFIQRLVEFDYVGARTYNGWYPKLFYQPGSEYVPYDPINVSGSRDSGDEKGSDYWDALVTTVHTDLPDDLVGDPGGILHEAIGNVQLLMAAVDCGPGNLAVYAGPVLSHYEFELGPATLRTEAEWKSQITNNIIPPAPEWTRTYLVPKP